MEKLDQMIADCQQAIERLKGMTDWTAAREYPELLERCE
jgi:hypothetical protein